MSVFKCKMCGGELNIIEGMTVTECEYCGSVQTIPSADNEKKLTLFARANRLRAGCEFDKAAGIYETIVADFPEEAEAYWGLVLCKYGIEYVDDPATGRKIPTCHRSSFNSVLEDSDFEQALENADVIARKVYREEARQIEELRKGIIAVSANECPYDIFICYKETAENGERTLDSVLAQDIYDALTEKKYRVFFSRITLEDKLGVEFEPYIFAALNSAKIMLAVGTDYEYYNAVWVKNEWSRYLKLMEQDKSKHLVPCFKGIDAYDMPKEFARLQAQDMGKVGAMQDLLRGIEKILGVSHTTSRTSALSSAPKITTQESPVERLLKNADTYLKLGDYNAATNTYQTLTKNYPENYKGWWGLIICRTSNFSKLITNQSELNTWLAYVKKLCIPEKFEPLLSQYIEYTRRISLSDAETDIKEANSAITTHKLRISTLEDEIKNLNQKKEEKAKQRAMEERRGNGDIRSAEMDLNRIDQELSKIDRARSRKTTGKMLGWAMIALGAVVCWISGLASNGASGSLFGVGLGIVGVIVMCITGKTKFTETDLNRLSSDEKNAQRKLSEMRNRKENNRKQYETYVANLKKSISEHEDDISHIRERVDACLKYSKISKEKISELWFSKRCFEFDVKKPYENSVLECREAAFGYKDLTQRMFKKTEAENRLYK